MCLNNDLLSRKVIYTPFIRRTGASSTANSPEPRSQAVWEDHACADSVKRKAAPHSPDVLQREPATGRANERAARGNDRPESTRHTSVVSKQALQRQEEVNFSETATATAAQRQNGMRFTTRMTNKIPRGLAYTCFVANSILQIQFLQWLQHRINTNVILIVLTVKLLWR